MTPLAIAHKVLNGDLSNAFGGLSKDDSHLFKALDNGHYITSYYLACGDRCHGSNYECISTIEEFINFKGDDVKTVYTQEMHDNGELPSVGMECLYKERGGINWCKCKVIAIHGVKIWIENLDKQSTPLNNISTLEFKPLTPPIELISGKAYQFDYYTGSVGMNNVVMRYRKSGDYFYFDNTIFERKFCTNIKPLTVEGK
jgi:hypothetical protein